MRGTSCLHEHILLRKKGLHWAFLTRWEGFRDHVSSYMDSQEMNVVDPVKFFTLCVKGSGCDLSGRVCSEEAVNGR